MKGMENFDWFCINGGISGVELKGRKNEKYVEVKIRINPEFILDDPEDVSTLKGCIAWGTAKDEQKTD